MSVHSTHCLSSAPLYREPPCQSPPRMYGHRSPHALCLHFCQDALPTPHTSVCHSQIRFPKAVPHRSHDSYSFGNNTSALPHSVVVKSRHLPSDHAPPDIESTPHSCSSWFLTNRGCLSLSLYHAVDCIPYKSPHPAGDCL